MNQFIKEYKDIGSVELFGDKDIVSQYIYENYKDLKLSEIDLNSIRTAFFDIEVFTRENGEESGFPDVQEARFEINSICHFDLKENVYYVFSLADWEKTESIHQDKEIKFRKFKTEKELLAGYLLFFVENRPDVLIGYNSKTFDVPYLINRYNKVLSHNQTKLFSPFKKIGEKKVRTNWGEAQTYEIYGLALLDYMELVEKYYLEPIESISLDYVGEHVLGMNKIHYPGTLNDLFLNEPEKFIDYNVRDVEILKKLDEALGYVSYTEGIAYTAKINFADTFSPVKIWNSLSNNRLRDKKIAPKIKLHHEKMGSFPGAYVYAEPGIMKQIISFDFTSLYPSVIRSLNIGIDMILSHEEEQRHRDNLTELCEDFPEVQKLLQTDDFVDFLVSNELPDVFKTYLKENQLSFSPSNNFYDISRKSVFAELMDEIFETRKAHKKKAQELKKKLKNDPENKKLKNDYNTYNVSQNSLKILLNSGYGSFSNVFFAYSDIRLAKSITITAQLLLKLSIKIINDYVNKLLKNKVKKNFVIISDTDSTYIELEELVTKVLGESSSVAERTDFIDKFGKRLEEKVLVPNFKSLGESLNFYQNVVSMKRELICAGYGPRKASGLCASMKHYYLLIGDSEGYKYDEGSEKEKIMGLFSKQRACPKFLKSPFNESLKILVTEGIEKSRKYIKKITDEFYSNTDLNFIAYVKSVTDVEKYMNPNTRLAYATSDEWFDPDLNKVRRGSVPENSRAALNYNFLLRKFKVTNKYDVVRNGDKVKIIHLKKNPFDFSVIAFKDSLPMEFGLEKYIDYDKHFEKLFFKPLNDIFKAATNEEIIRTSSLSNFF
jgi:DNA polymerase elongation subunit (family B)